MTLTVSHNFVSPIADQGDPTLFGPNEWNDTHAITGSEADGPAGAVQFKNGGAFGGDAAFSVPAIGSVSLGSLASATRAQFEFVAEDGTNVTIQPLPATTNWTFSLPTSAGTITYVLQTDGAGVTSWVPQTGASGNITVGATTVLGGTTKHVMYDLAGIFEEAANFTIESGNPNVTAGNAYLYDGEVFAASDPVFNIFLGHFTGNFGTISGPDNIVLGRLAGASLTTDDNNVIIGPAAGYNLSGSSQNTFIGYHAGEGVGSGSNNFALGAQAMRNAGSTADSNVSIGSQALKATTGSNSIAIGNLACFRVTSGTGNTGIGLNSLSQVTSMNNSTAVGSNSLNSVDSVNNCGFGESALINLLSGDTNTGIGKGCGGTLTTGNQCIVIGGLCDFPSAANSGQLVIGNYIYGTGLTGTGATISTAKIGIGIKAPACELDVGGIISTKGYTIAATLPAAGTVGRRAYVTDSAAAPVFMAVAAGGGTTVVPVFDDGTNWIYA